MSRTGNEAARRFLKLRCAVETDGAASDPLGNPF